MLRNAITSSLLVLGLCAFTATPSSAQDADAVRLAIENALPGTLLHDPLNYDWVSRGGDMKSKVVDAAELTSGQAMQVRIKKKKPKAWDSVITLEMEDGVKSGDKIEIHFWARTKKAAAGKETADITLFVGRNQEPYDYIVSEQVLPSSEWKMQTIRGVAKSDYNSGRLKAEFQLARASQTIEFGPIYISNLGQ